MANDRKPVDPRVIEMAKKILAGRAAKDDVIRVRIPATVKQALIVAAQREGLELSAWVRQVAMRAAGVLPPK